MWDKKNLGTLVPSRLRQFTPKSNHHDQKWSLKYFAFSFKHHIVLLFLARMRTFTPNISKTVQPA